MLNRAWKYSRTSRSNSPFCVPSSSRTRTGQNEIARQVQRSERLFLRHRGELVEEMVERLTAFQVVEERLNRHSRAAKDGRASRDSGPLWTTECDSARIRSMIVHQPDRRRNSAVVALRARRPVRRLALLPSATPYLLPAGLPAVSDALSRF